MKNSPSSEERRGITGADVQPAQGERLECRSARSIDPLERRKCQAITRLDGKLHRSRGKGIPPSKGICKCFDFKAKRAFQEPFRFAQLVALRGIIKTGQARWL